MYLGEERRQYARYRARSMTTSISFQDVSSGEICVESVQPIDFKGNYAIINCSLSHPMDKFIKLCSVPLEIIKRK